MAMGTVEAIYKLNILFFVDTGKIARGQGNHREFGINWSVVTL